MTIKTKRSQTLVEEIYNSALHWAGAVAAVFGLLCLVLRNRGAFGGDIGSSTSLAACSVYGASMILLFSASALYHGSKIERVKKIMQTFDHSGIYILIAGTYTPICLILIPNTGGLALVIVEWTLAVLGVTLNFLNIKSVKRMEIIIWLVMGWAIVIKAPELILGAPRFSLAMLLAGGIVYSLGVIFYKKPQQMFFHVIWHIFVLTGAALQWTSIYIISL